MTQTFGQDAFIKKDRRALYGEGQLLEIWDDFNVIPFGVTDYPAKFQIDPFRWSSKKIGDRSRTQLVFDHQPRCGHPPLYDEAQHLLCQVLEPPQIAGPFIHIPPKGSLVVAKVYDALFYTPVSDFGHERIDTVAEADREIAHEGAAYRHLSEMSDKAAHPKSTIIPSLQLKFYGLWHFAAKSQDPAFAGSTRSVRLFLLELKVLNTSGRYKKARISQFLGLTEVFGQQHFSGEEMDAGRLMREMHRAGDALDPDFPASQVVLYPKRFHYKRWLDHQ
ncbi:hypothetical protein B0T11DRAFT_323157 [Plectosphaerella cucumerina]|uniref:Uncharacterized protein n=1 Tax=Plectosphaerella cucumerina TaxID=40658 RepID=A0A8K0TSL5_9PEZI|nr:hypothetical protein B0T11DRAFT_323157 [Plectosphaerella cucumerina]